MRAQWLIKCTPNKKKKRKKTPSAISSSPGALKPSRIIGGSSFFICTPSIITRIIIKIILINFDVVMARNRDNTCIEGGGEWLRSANVINDDLITINKCY